MTINIKNSISCFCSYSSKKMLEAIFKNQVLMTFVIASIWIIPGILFTSATNRKYKDSQIERQIKKVAKLYP